MNSQRLKHNPGSRYREVTVLRSLGLREDEINYLVRMKEKNMISLKYRK